ncbi:MAG: hypothetical protein IKI83_05275 [Prevotella sp.]|nr:hypothetical protein [Prevotella sp.]
MKKREEESKAYWKEYHRMEDLYKKGELQRWELPRSLDGISHFEFNYDGIGNCIWKDFFYIENEYNECLNAFFQTHGHVMLKHGLRVLYLPQLIKDLGNEEIIKYRFPDIGNTQISLPQIDSTFLIQQLSYPEDSKKLKHGLISFHGQGTNRGAKYVWGDYFPLDEGDDASIFDQINRIAKEHFGNNAGGLYSTVEKNNKGKKKSKNHADLYFNWEINDLLDEIKERVEKLEQLGLPRTLLQKIIQGEPKLSRLIVTKDYRIILPDYGDMEIKMEPLNKAVYLLFLKHPNGIIFKYLPDYREELTKIYASMKPYGINERVLKSIEDVTNPCLNSINEKCARIRGSFVSQFDEELAKNYYIYGQRGEPKKISLPQEMIEWEE